MPEMLFRALLFALVSAYFTVTHADEKFVLPSDYSPSDFSHDWIKTFINSGEKGVLTALVADPSARGSPLQMAFYLDSKQSFTARVLFGNFTESDLSFTLVGLLDYKQISLSLNNIQQRNHSFFLKVGEKIEQQIGIDEMKAGAHDFVLLAFKDNGKSERFTDAEMAPLYFRMNIFVGCYDVPSVNYDIAVSTEAHLGTGGIRLERQWTVVGPATKDLPMIPAWVENSSEHEQEYVIVPFVQDPETGTLENEFTPRYIRVPGRTRQSYELPLGTQGARKGGVIRAILAPNPYMRLEDPRGAIVQKPSELNTSNAVE